MSAKIVASAPGKVILFGEHAVVFEKRALATAVDKRTRVEISDNDSNQITVILSDLNCQHSWIANDIKIISNCENKLAEIDRVLDTTAENAKESFKTVLFLYINMVQEFGDKFHGIKISISSTIPIGGGLGSSAAFSVAVSAALLKLFSNSQDPNLDLVNKWAFQCEQIFHGRPSGIDNATSTYGGTLSFSNGDIEKVEDMQLSKLILVETKVQRNTKKLVNATSQRRQKFPQVIGKVIDAIGDVSHEALTCFSKPEMGDLKMLVEINQHLLNALGAGHPKIDEIVGIAKRHGMSAKLTGAGGGGCVIVFPDDISAVQTLVSELEESGFRTEEIAVNARGLSFQ